MCDNSTPSKLKFNDKGFDRELEINKVIYVPGLLPSSANNQSSSVEVETDLLRAETTFNRKSEIELKTDEKEKNEVGNFFVENSKKRESINHGDYIRNGYKGNGRGFGNQEISQQLRYGENSRDVKKTARSTDLKDYKFHDLLLDLHDEDNVVLPFPRGGIDTRNLDKYRNN